MQTFLSGQSDDETSALTAAHAAAVHVAAELVFTRRCKSLFTPGCINDGVHSFRHASVTVQLGLSAATGVFFLSDRYENAEVEPGGSQPWLSDLLLKNRSIYLTTSDFVSIYILFAWAGR